MTVSSSAEEPIDEMPKEIDSRVTSSWSYRFPVASI